jgi:hypothetical protein
MWRRFLSVIVPDAIIVVIDFARTPLVLVRRRYVTHHNEQPCGVRFTGGGLSVELIEPPLK